MSLHSSPYPNLIFVNMLYRIVLFVSVHYMLLFSFCLKPLVSYLMHFYFFIPFSYAGSSSNTMSNRSKETPILALFLILKTLFWASLVVQRLRIRLPMQGTRVQVPDWEDPTCRGATKPMRLNYWACVLEPKSHNYWACEPQLLKPACLGPMLRNKWSHHNEKPAHRNEE